MGVNRNTNLHAAKKVKNDEFYTKLSDVENELRHYKTHVKGKIVYCNCDDPNWSSFYKYFTLNFKHLGLKKVITTHYSKDISSDPAYMEECILGEDGNTQITRTTLKGDGDFRSEECIALLHQADIVCTNPPFSLFREYIGLLAKMKKSFLVIGSQNAITYKEIFRLIMNNDVWLGISKPKVFSTPQGEEKKFGNICWYTNLMHANRLQKIRLWKKYGTSEYPKYDNYNAIEVGKVAEIPMDYDDEMGVPITFLEKYNPQQFLIVGLANDKRVIDDAFVQGQERYLDDQHKKFVGMVLSDNGTLRAPYARIIIKKKV
ncbi:adenine-specific methyltransferase EcoRI family protein [Diaphorobacter sp.]|uniref:adenine-specific methyltransferase EcoRI family protein n=1 Tax=Diaphorobacter sp. TaxID=1934310 RepID=UPI003D0CEF9A